MNKAIDFYLDHPLFVDFIIILAMLLGNHFLPTLILFKFELSAQITILSSLIGTSVSLAGFILAALTIIVSFRSNIACKQPENAKNPLELIFSTEHYQNIIHVFKDAIIELTATFVGLYIIWIISENLKPELILQANVYGGLLIFLSLFRTLFTLFLVLKLHKNTERENT
jgi:glycerol uptake facilitator-like aquaporin